MARPTRMSPPGPGTAPDPRAPLRSRAQVSASAPKETGEPKPTAQRAGSPWQMSFASEPGAADAAVLTNTPRDRGEMADGCQARSASEGSLSRAARPRGWGSESRVNSGRPPGAWRPRPAGAGSPIIPRTGRASSGFAASAGTRSAHRRVHSGAGGRINTQRTRPPACTRKREGGGGEATMDARQGCAGMSITGADE